MKVLMIFKRVLAFLFDYVLVILPYSILLYYASTYINSNLFSFHQELNESYFLLLVPFIFLTLPTILYYTFTESGKNSASFGKRILKLKVISDEQRNSIGACFKRNFLKFIPWELGHQIAFITMIETYPMKNFVAYPAILISLTFLVANIIYFWQSNENNTLYDKWSNLAIIKIDKK